MDAPACAGEEDEADDDAVDEGHCPNDRLDVGHELSRAAARSVEAGQLADQEWLQKDNFLAAQAAMDELAEELARVRDEHIRRDAAAEKIQFDFGTGAGLSLSAAEVRVSLAPSLLLKICWRCRSKLVKRITLIR